MKRSHFVGFQFTLYNQIGQSVGLALILFAFLIVGQHYQPKLCSSVCMCLSSEKLVDCTEGDGLIAIPVNLPPYAIGLSIQSIRFNGAATRLKRANLTHISKLQKVKISNTGLLGIDREAFVDMINLRELDLSQNKLSLLESYTFSMLNLSTLRLDSNPHIQFTSESLRGLQVIHLSLRSCGIQQLIWSQWQSIRVTHLDLYNNSIKLVNPEFGNLFRSAPAGEIREVNMRTLDLSMNPLECYCHMSWYRRYLQELMLSKQRAGGGLDFTDHIIQCHSPESLKGKRLTALTDSQLGCSTTTIAEVTVDLKEFQTIGLAHLRCLAVSSNGPPRVVLTSIEHDNAAVSVREYSNNSVFNMARFGSSNLHYTQASMNVSLKEDLFSSNFMCVANGANDMGISDTTEHRMNILLSGIQHFLPLSLQPNNYSELPSPILYSLEKRFTLIQMILAVISTFVLTCLLVCGLYRLLHCNTHRIITSPTHLQQCRTPAGMFDEPKITWCCCPDWLVKPCCTSHPTNESSCSTYSAVHSVLTPVMSNNNVLLVTPVYPDQDYDIPQHRFMTNSFGNQSVPGDLMHIGNTSEVNTPRFYHQTSATPTLYHWNYKPRDKYHFNRHATSSFSSKQTLLQQNPIASSAAASPPPPVAFLAQPLATPPPPPLITQKTSPSPTVSWQ